MRIIVAQAAGFCMGVKRAVDLALEHAGKPPGIVRTLGPLIHNNQTLEMLKDRGIEPLDETFADPRTPILVRAHGVPHKVQESYRQKGHAIIDGTCPKVKTVHRVIEKYRNLGFDIVITGDEGHAEVVGLQSFAGDHGRLISAVADIERLPDFKKVCLVSQTTFDKTAFDAIAANIKKRYAGCEVVIKKTICSATDQRQSETSELAARVDTMIVVGGKNSANTMRLARIASEKCRGPVQHVETENEIDWRIVMNCRTVGITAGASTPNWMIKRVVDYLTFMDRTKKKGIMSSIRFLFDLCANLNIFVSIGVVCVYFTSCVLQGLLPESSGAFILFLYFFSMYLWNSLAIVEDTQHLDLSRYKFYHARKKLFFAIAAITIFSLLTISFLQNKYLFYLMLFAVAAGSVYHMTIIPPFLLGITRYKSLKDVPNSRDLFVALSWTILITFIPQVMTGKPIFSASTWFCFFLIFVFAYLRSLIFDLRDIEGDRIMGRETLVTIIGEERVKKAIQFIIAFSIAVLVLCSLLFPSSEENSYFLNKSNLFQLQTVPLLYLFFFMIWNRRNKMSRSTFFNLFADAQFYLSGLCAWLGMTINL